MEYKEITEPGFRKKNITTKVQDQETVEEVCSCLTKNILQAAENTIPKTTLRTKERSPLACWNENF